MYKRKKQTKTTSMLDKKIVDLINEQIWLENNASFYYLHLSIQFSINGFGGISDFFKEQSEEEREHMLKLVDYLLDEDVTPNIPNYNFIFYDLKIDGAGLSSSYDFNVDGTLFISVTETGANTTLSNTGSSTFSSVISVI